MVTSPGKATAEQLLNELQLSRFQLELQNEELRQTQAELAAERSRYHHLYELAPVGYCSISEQGLILLVNRAASTLLGVNRATVINQSFARYIQPDDQNTFQEYRHTLITTRSAQSFELRMMSNEATPFIALLVATIAHDDDGAPVLHLVMSDITARKQDQELRTKKEAAESANQAKSRFLAAASHDLRQPTHALGMFVARLAQLPHDAQTRHLVGCLDASVCAMQDMLDTLFDVSRLDAGSVQTRVSCFPVDRVLAQLHHSLTHIAAEKSLRLRFRPCAAWVLSDPALIHSILLNLIGNAIRYTHQGSILVACRNVHGGTQLRIEVWDSGIGIEPQYHDSIFDEFFQIGNNERDRNNGLGLGLSIVQRTCRLLSHPLSLSSVPGRGTRFSLTVPLTAIPSPMILNSTPADAVYEELEGLRVLIIEDDELGRTALTGLLESWGCSVSVADGVAMACKAVQGAQRPDVIVSDFRLRGGTTGIEAIQRLRQLTGHDITACLMSGDTDTYVRQLAQEGGFVLLHKPVRPAKLRSLLRRLNPAKEE